MAVQGSGPVVCTLCCWFAGMSSNRHEFKSRTDRFLHFFFTCLAEKISFPCTIKACQKKLNAHRVPIGISLCAGWVCSTDLQSSLGVYMVPER